MKLIKIKNIILNPIKDNSELAEAIPVFAAKQGINIIYPKNKDILTTYPNGYVQIFQTQNNKIDSNESSLVTLFTQNDKNILFTGDAEIETIEKIKLPNKIDVLKIGHHGADNTINKSFLDKKQVKASVLSTGPSAYNHPTPGTLKEIQGSQSILLRTDTDNAIKIVISDYTDKIYRYKQKKWHLISKFWYFNF